MTQWPCTTLSPRGCGTSVPEAGRGSTNSKPIAGASTAGRCTTTTSGIGREAEFLEWKARDPIVRLEHALIANGTLTVAEIKAERDAIEHEVRDAFEFAENSPFPDPRDAYTDVYAETGQ